MYNYGYPNIQGFDMNTQRQIPPYQPVNNMQQVQPLQQMQSLNNQTTLLGKSVDSVDVVKAMDIPLDGRISYFPLVDGSAIVTKQLQADGTSKTIIYKPTEDDKKEQPKYVTMEDLNKSLKEIDLSEIEDLRDEIDSLKKQIKDLKGKNKRED